MSTTTPTDPKRRQAAGLPAEVTSFVGRRHEVAETRRLLCEARLLTLTGVGGVGKTRLALRVAAEMGRAFRDGVWLVDLAGLPSPELLVQSVTEAMKIQVHSSRPLMEVLTDHLRDRQVLLILDNCEHLLRDCAVLAETLIRSTSAVRILATSRQPLGIVGEQTMPVPTLSVPSPGISRLPIGSLAQCDAIRLFVERARAVLPDFALTEDNRDAVEWICRRLDGIPLAIELAAVRLRALTVEQLLARLDDRFRMLTAGSPAALPRQQTLRALIDWSHALCTERERLLWARVSVFSDGLDLEAAEEICSGEGIDREEVAELVMGLVDKSILVRDDHPSHLPAARYRLLETVRQYGQERLVASGQESALQQRHRDYYRKLAAEAYTQRFGPLQVAWFSRLRLEHANLRSALEYCFTEPTAPAAGLEMTADLLYHWITSYYLSEGRRWLDRALLADTAPSEVRARALWANSWLAIIQADIASATVMLREARALGEQLGQQAPLAYAALYSGMVAMYRGDAESAIPLYQEAIALHRATGDPMGLALGLIRLSLAYSFQGDSPHAVSIGEDCLALCDAHGENWHRAYMMMALGIEIWRQGDVRRATELEKESLRFNRSLDDLLGVGINLEVLAWIAATQNQYQRAARLLGILDTVWRAVEAPLSGYGHLIRYHDECEARTREALGEAAFDAAVRRGAATPYAEALSFALEERESTAGKPSEGTREPSPLTRRETEIARLVAQGLSNKDIAASLVIAQRTAEGHIEHILNKLGFHSRAQIAVWIGEQIRDVDGEHPSGT
ncbi:putative ATPase/DNA-binding CsgD family transcriptional regulator [Streptosporangium album]|uniref:Putative ATPase/DNA-binding CsgD family transcriptional regulator n=1 Tax=Streptosporangium album TaxID=47479 RepID=A0A7W7RYJ0_9ACTN|nr:LuxR C-terminal-related transcriptional regulator [Streptosporangium album]MBB4940490.1 putative ATPase/DNA-binding CsgD family transcriptional regulator [Streptosporangium album]